MAWLRVESRFPNHQKVLAAGQQLGRGAIGRVMGLWTVGACYAVDHLTDGFVPAIVMEDPRYDRKPAEVIAAMCCAGLLQPSRDGYQFHDFTHYNPPAETVKAKRRADLERKNRTGIAADSAQNRDGIRSDSNALAGADGRTRPNPNPIPKIKTIDQEQREDAPDVHRVLVRLAHEVIEAVSPDAEEPTVTEMGNRLKDLAASKGITWRYSREIEKAMTSALTQRQKRSA